MIKIAILVNSKSTPAKISMSSFHNKYEKLTKRLPKDYDLVRIGLRLSNDYFNASLCHSEPFGKTCRRAQVESLRTGSAKTVIVILSSAKDLEILRLTPQNDVVGQALGGKASGWILN